MLDNPWLVAAPLLVVVAITGTQFARSGRKGLLIVAVACSILAGALFVFDSLHESPVEQVAAQLDRLVSAGREQDAETIVAAISPQYEHGGQSFDSLAASIRSELSRYAPRTLRINGVAFDKDGDEVVAKFVVATSGTYNQFAVENYRLRLAVTFRQEGTSWRIWRVDRKPLVGDPNATIPLDQR